MFIPEDFLEVKNYDGTRLIEINDKKVVQLKAELKKLQLEANPILKETEKIFPKLDPFYVKKQKLMAEIKKLEEEMKPVNDEYMIHAEKLEKIDQKAQLIKNKMQPIVVDIVKGQLKEFEKANQIVEKEGKMYVEVTDEVEEKIKAIRATKNAESK